MKKFITDQFLLDMIYPFVGAAGNVVDFLLSNKYRQIHMMMGDDNPVIQKYKKDVHGKNFKQFIYYLKKNNYIKSANLENKEAFMLTKEGIDKVLKASFKTEEKRKRKDGKWVMIAFDIPQTQRRQRKLLRSVLQNLGYKIFQQSVWITPYDVSEKTEQLLQHYSLEKYIKIFLIEEI